MTKHAALAESFTRCELLLYKVLISIQAAARLSCASSRLINGIRVTIGWDGMLI